MWQLNDTNTVIVGAVLILILCLFVYLMVRAARKAQEKYNKAVKLCSNLEYIAVSSMSKKLYNGAEMISMPLFFWKDKRYPDSKYVSRYAVCKVGAGGGYTKVSPESADKMGGLTPERLSIDTSIHFVAQEQWLQLLPHSIELR
jgi:hypothetical protein